MRHTKAQRRVADGTALLRASAEPRGRRARWSTTRPRTRASGSCAASSSTTLRRRRAAPSRRSAARRRGIHVRPPRAPSRRRPRPRPRRGTSATLVRRRLRDVDRLLRRGGDGARHGARHDSDGERGPRRRAGRVRGSRARAALSTRRRGRGARRRTRRACARAPRRGARRAHDIPGRRTTGSRAPRDRSLSAARGDADGVSAPLNANMRSFEADGQAWRGDLAVRRRGRRGARAETARVTESVHKALRAHAARAPRESQRGAAFAATPHSSRRIGRVAPRGKARARRKARGHVSGRRRRRRRRAAAFSPCACENATEPPIFTPALDPAPREERAAGVKREAAADDASAAGSSAFPASPRLIGHADDDGFCCDARRAPRALALPRTAPVARRSRRAPRTRRSPRRSGRGRRLGRRSPDRGSGGGSRWSPSPPAPRTRASREPPDDGASTLEGLSSAVARARGGAKPPAVARRSVSPPRSASRAAARFDASGMNARAAGSAPSASGAQPRPIGSAVLEELRRLVDLEQQRPPCSTRQRLAPASG